MATTITRSALTLKSLTTQPNRLSFKRFFASSSAYHDEAEEAKKWEKITYAGIATCTILAIFNLSKGHHEFPDPPPYPYLHIRNKEFPWGPDGLLEKKKKHSEH